MSDLEKFDIFVPLAKVDEKQRMVWGWASTERKDLQGEIIKSDAIKKALPDYMEWANIREMHRASAVGIAKEADVRPMGNGEDGLWLGAKIVDDDAWTKVEEGVYKGFSVGGERLAKVGKEITEIRLVEISLVDRPANPDCKIEVVKVAQPFEKHAFGFTDPNEINEGDFVDSMSDEEKHTLRSRIVKWLFPDRQGWGEIADLKKAEQPGGGKEVVAEIANPVDTQKSIYTVQDMATAYSMLRSIKEYIKQEAAWENDPKDREYASKVQNLMSIMGELMVAYLQDELEEEREGTDEDDLAGE